MNTLYTTAHYIIIIIYCLPKNTKYYSNIIFVGNHI